MAVHAKAHGSRARCAKVKRGTEGGRRRGSLAGPHSRFLGSMFACMPCLGEWVRGVSKHARSVSVSHVSGCAVGNSERKICLDLRDVLMNHRNEILAKTWSDNYEPYINEALRLINSGEATDGHTLLKNTLSKWAGKAPSRAAC